MRAKRKAGVLPAHAIEVDGQTVCSKCSRAEHLVRHHIKAYADGGADSPDNLIWLCEHCHEEWHAVEDAYEFWHWMTLPSALWLLNLMASTDDAFADPSDALTVGQLRRQMYRNQMRHVTWSDLPLDPRGVAHMAWQVEELKREERQRRG